MGQPHQITRQPSEWLGGLNPILKDSRGATVLDIGCHNGAVLRAFAENGACILHGADVWEEGVAKTKELGDKRFVIACTDFRNGFQAVERALPLLPVYDVVVYCAIHHHLDRQMGSERALEFATALFSRALARVVLRGAHERMAELGNILTSMDFKLELNYNVSDKGGVYVWRRS